MKVLVCDYMISKHHFEVGLEASIDLAAQGLEVIYRNIYPAVPETEWGFGRDERAMKNLLLFDSVIGTALNPLTKGLRKLEALCEAKNVEVDAGLVTSIDTQEKVPFASINSLEGLRNLKFGTSRIGLGVASSLISFTKNSRPDPQEYRNLVARMIVAATKSAFWMEEMLRASPDIEAVSIFNGRFAVARTLVDVAESAGRTVLYRERVPNQDNTRYFHCEFSPHDSHRLSQKIRREWELAVSQAPAITKAVGASYFDEAASKALDGTDGFGPARDLKVPGSTEVAALTQDTKIVAFFSSSEDEYEAAGHKLESAFRSQQDACAYLQRLARELNFQLVARIHPRVASLSEQERYRWDHEVFKKSANVSIVPSDSRVSSYELIHLADTVIVWHSSIGSEAVHMGKQTIDLTRSVFAEAGVDITFPASRSVLKQILADPPTKPRRESSLIRGFAAFGIGTPLKYYVASSSWSGKFDGVDLHKWVKMLGAARRMLLARRGWLRPS